MGKFLQAVMRSVGKSRRALSMVATWLEAGSTWAKSHPKLVAALTTGGLGTGLASFFGTEKPKNLDEALALLRRAIAGSDAVLAGALQETFASATFEEMNELIQALIESAQPEDRQDLADLLAAAEADGLSARQTGDRRGTPVKSMDLTEFRAKEKIIREACYGANLTPRDLTALRRALALDQNDFEYVISNMR